MSAAFVLWNRHTSAVEIRSVSAGCSCQVATATKSKVEPNESVSVNVKWVVGSRRGTVSDGVSVLYAVSGPDAPPEIRQVGLRIEAEIEPDVNVEPPALTVKADPSEQARLKLSAGRLKQFTVNKVYSNSQQFSVAYDSIAQEAVITRRGEGKLEFGPGLYAAIETNSVNEPTIYIPLIAPRAP